MLMPDLNGDMFPILVLLDLASDKLVMKLLEADSNKVTASAAEWGIQDGWFSWAGSPQRIQKDQDSAFRSVVEETCNNLGIPQIPIARDAHWQHGRLENKIKIVKHMSRKVFKDMNVTGRHAVAIGCFFIANACNKLTNNKGFSPDQWVLGHGIKLPNSLCDPDNDPVVQTIPRPGTEFHYRLEMQQKC